MEKKKIINKYKLNKENLIKIKNNWKKNFIYSKKYNIENNNKYIVEILQITFIIMNYGKRNKIKIKLDNLNDK